MSEPTPQDRQAIHLEIFRQMLSLATAGFGLVAALAWNDAIQTLFAELFGRQSSIYAKFAYAVLVTALVVTVTMRLSRVVNRLERHDR